MEYTLKSITVHVTPGSFTVTQNTHGKHDNHLYIIIEPDITNTAIQRIRIKWTEHKIDTVLFGDYLSGIVHCMKGDGEDIYNRLQAYMIDLDKSEIDAIVRYYKKHIDNGILFDGFLAGIASYFALAWLIDKNVQLPFVFRLPCPVASQDILTRNVFNYMNMPLVVLGKITNGIITQLITFVQNFIRMWEPVFIKGPAIDAAENYQTGLNILLGYTQDLIDKINKQERKYDDLLHRIEKLEFKNDKFFDRGKSDSECSEDSSSESSESEHPSPPPRRIWSRRR